MEVKAILDKIKKEEEAKKELFFALQIDEQQVSSAVWTIEAGSVKILAVSEPQAWEDEDRFLAAIDLSLSSVTEKLPPEEEEPNQVIYGVTPVWVEDNQIKADKLTLLKKIGQELDLTAIGFVVTTEAIVHHLKTKEGIPPTAILVGLQPGKLLITLVKLGKIIGMQMVSASADLGADLIEGLSRFSQEELFPPRIFLYDSGQKLEKEKEQLLDYNWPEEKERFLHLPKVETLAAGFSIRSIALAGGREAAKDQSAKVALVKDEAVGPAEEEIVSAPAGFLAEADITQQEPVDIPKTQEETLSSSSLEEPAIKKKNKISLPRLNFVFLTQLFSRLKFSSLLPKDLLAKRASKIIFVLGLILLLCLAAFFALWWYLPKAEINLWVKPQLLEKKFSVRLDSEATAADVQELILPAKTVAVTVSGEKSAATTGSKLIGEPARGEVAIFNGTGQEKTFAQGTLIKSASGIEFTLDKEVAVASQSGTAADPTPGKAMVAVTAVEIGTEGNLAANSEFSIASFSKSDYVAKNEEALTGGTSREVQVVTKEDREGILVELSRELEEKSIAELKSQLETGREIISDSLITEVIKKEFDQELEAEAETVSLDLELLASAFTFNQEEFAQIAETKILAAVPAGYEYRAEESEVDFELEKVTEGQGAVFTVFFKTKLFPQLDLGSIKANLRGKKLEIGEAFLDNLPMVDSFEVKIIPRLPARLVTFPRVEDKIRLNVGLE